MKRPNDASPELAEHADAASWEAWLAKHHGTSPGVWLKLQKGGAKTGALTYQQALDAALCFGWIDGQKGAVDDNAWKQRFTPRRPRSIWSQRNCARAEELVQEKRMRPAGQAEIDRAKKDGRWQAAYASPKNATVPDDLAAALAKNAKAAAFFESIDGANRFAILYRVTSVKTAETRARKIAEFVAMLSREETLHPPRAKKNAAATKKAPARKTKTRST